MNWKTTSWPILIRISEIFILNTQAWNEFFLSELHLWSSNKNQLFPNLYPNKEKSGISCLSNFFFRYFFCWGSWAFLGWGQNIFPGFAIFFQVFAPNPLFFQVVQVWSCFSRFSRFSRCGWQKFWWLGFSQFAVIVFLFPGSHWCLLDFLHPIDWTRDINEGWLMSRVVIGLRLVICPTKEKQADYGWMKSLSHYFPEVQHVAPGKINNFCISDHDITATNNMMFHLGDRHNNAVCRKWEQELD